MYLILGSGDPRLPIIHWPDSEDSAKAKAMRLTVWVTTMCGANQRILLKISRGQAETSRFYPRRVRWRYLNFHNTVMTTPGRGYQVGKVQSLDIQSFSWGYHVVSNSLLRHQASPKANRPLPWVKFSRPTSLVRNFQDIQTQRDTLLAQAPNSQK